jgi:DNA mismatch endonuclease (patch repair protein)
MILEPTGGGFRFALEEISMADNVQEGVRSRMMAGIKGKDTKPEMQVRSYLHRAGFRYALHRRDLPGKPDLVLPKFRVVIFVHGCFWHQHHGCSIAVMPSTRREFWELKLEGNRSRDERVVASLRDAGWRVGVVWECALRKAAHSTLEALVAFLMSDRAYEKFSWNQEPKIE